MSQAVSSRAVYLSDFGVFTSQKNPNTISSFETALKNHMRNPQTVQQGIYGFVDSSKIYFNPSTNNIVVLDSVGNFVTGFKLQPGSAQFENYLKNGIVR